MSTGTRGLTAIILAYSIWGLFPVYWKQLRSVDPAELLLLRLLLTALACLLLLRLRPSWKPFTAAWLKPRLLGRTVLAAALLSGNWFSFIWAVANNRILESSLGYFLCPLVSVLLGRFVEKESLGRRRWSAVALSALGVALLIMEAGSLPMAAIAIALTWSSYGLMKKRSGLTPLLGLGLETSLLAPIAGVVLMTFLFAGSSTLPGIDPGTLAYLSVAGFLTAAPLLLFAYAARRIRLSTMGMGQYIVPSAHFLLAAAYGETISLQVLGSFALIWVALGIYSLRARHPGAAAKKGGTHVGSRPFR